MTRAPSVTRQLVLAVAVPLVLSFALTVVVLDRVFQDSAMQALRERLDQEVVSLITAAELTDEGRMDVRLLDPESRLSRPHSGQYAAVRNQRGRTLWSSASIADLQLDFGPAVPVGSTTFFERTMADGTVVGVLNRGLEWDYAPGNYAKLIFSAAEDLSGQRARLVRFRQRLIAWFSILTLLLLAVLGLLLRQVLRPVHRLEQEIAEVDSGRRAQLGAGFPRELSGVARSLNALLHSEQQRITRYRDTLGNLAHSLKTPLAVMRATLSGEPNPLEAGQRAALHREIDRIAQIADHQLQRAATSGGATLGQSSVALLPIVSELRTTMLKVHAHKDLVIEMALNPDAGFVGDAGDITEMLGNLLDNACKWCRGWVRIHSTLVAGRPAKQNLLIVVEDDGPGIALQDRGRVLARGIRVDEQSPGHGIGLSMVAETVALYGGELVIGEAALTHGARLEIAVPGRLLEADVLTSSG